MTIADGGFMGYYIGQSTYEILEITENRMVVRSIPGNTSDLAWYHIFTTTPVDEQDGGGGGGPGRGGPHRQPGQREEGLWRNGGHLQGLPRRLPGVRCVSPGQAAFPAAGAGRQSRARPRSA